MTLVRYLSTTLEESLINWSSISSGPVALFALSDLNILYLPYKLEISQNPRSMVKHFPLWLQHMDGFYKSDFFNCSSILTLGITIATWGWLLSRSGLYNIYIEVVQNFSSFFRVIFKDSVFFKSDAIIRYDMIPLLVKKFLIVFQNDLLPSLLLLYGFLVYYLVILLHLFFSFL